jgi:uncharacterized protein with FMN-binding domain
MKKIIYALLATVSGLVLLFSYRTSLGQEVPATALADAGSTGTSTSGSSPTGSGTTSGSGSTDSGSSTSGTASSSNTGSSSSGASLSGSGLSDGSFTGQAVNTRFGPVQVQITVSGGSITDVTVPEYPDSNGRDQQINGYALPQLVSETLSAQSANIDMVSGATYTSDGYLQSLQSAIDQASS